MDKVKVAVVQAEGWFGEEEYRNPDRALAYVEEAVKHGVHLICFPEGYPGPARGPLVDAREKQPYPPLEALREKARQHGVYISAGDLEPNPELEGTYFLTQKLISPEGEVLANYRRVQPDHPPLNAYLFDGRKHILPGDDLTVVDTDLGKVGLLICSELFVPELARIEMLQGARIILAPVNGPNTRSASRSGTAQLKDTWHCIARARAAENLLYVVIAENVFRVGDDHYWLGAGCVASPEELLATSEGPGIQYVELDMERIDYLRKRDIDEQALRGTKEVRKTRMGQTYDRRPDIYGRLVEPDPEAWDYFYYEKGLDAWEKAYQAGIKVRRSTQGQ